MCAVADGPLLDLVCLQMCVCVCVLAGVCESSQACGCLLAGVCVLAGACVRPAAGLLWGWAGVEGSVCVCVLG